MMTTAAINGHSLKVWECCVTHLRAVSPVSVDSLRNWMVDQIPGVERNNVEAVCQQFLNDAKDRGVIRFDNCDELGLVVDMNW